MRADHPVCDRCPAYDADILPEETRDSMEEYIERQLEEARMKKFKPAPTKEEDRIEVIEANAKPVEHAADCSIWLTDECDCGAE